MSTTTPADQPSTASARNAAEALTERLFGAVLGMLDVSTIYIGDRLGLYEALATSGAATSGELASATAT